jgi:hypothetical protein
MPSCWIGSLLSGRKSLELNDCRANKQRTVVKWRVFGSYLIPVPESGPKVSLPCRTRGLGWLVFRRNGDHYEHSSSGLDLADGTGVGVLSSVSDCSRSITDTDVQSAAHVSRTGWFVSYCQTGSRFGGEPLRNNQRRWNWKVRRVRLWHGVQNEQCGERSLAVQLQGHKPDDPAAFCCVMRAEIFTVPRRTAARSGTAVAAFKPEGVGRCTRSIKPGRRRCYISSRDFRTTAISPRRFWLRMLQAIFTVSLMKVAPPTLELFSRLKPPVKKGFCTTFPGHPLAVGTEHPPRQVPRALGAVSGFNYLHLLQLLDGPDLGTTVVTSRGC